MSLTKISQLPNQDMLNNLFTYDNGKLFWKKVPVDYQLSIGMAKRERSALTRNTKYGGKEAGHLFKTSSGAEAVQVRILGKSYDLHRIIFKMLTGEEPNLIDHINGNPTDNRIENLRSVDNQTNTRNAKKFSTNTSGHVGVSWSKSMNKWESYIWNDCKKIKIGYFSDINEAIKARQEAQTKLGFHANHGR